MKNLGKKIMSSVVAAVILCMSLVPTGSALNTKAAASQHRVPCGSFIQYYMTGNWSDERWQQELKAMKDAGMEYLIFSPSVTIDDKTGKTTAIYPTNLADYKKGYSGKDYIDPVLRNCEKAGMKVFIALNQSSKFWDYGWKVSTTPADEYSNYWKKNAQVSNELADDLYATYKAKYPNAFYGWYWVYELWNYQLCTNAYEGHGDSDSAAPDPTVYTNIIAKDGFDPVLSHLTSVDSKMPIMLSPFCNRSLCNSADSVARFWSDIIKNTDFRPGDIIAPQDSIGAGGTKLPQLDEVFAAYKKAVDTNPNLHLWSNDETFEGTEGYIAPVNRVIQQIETTSKYAEANITFAWNHYYSPYNVLPGYDKAYMQYVTDGTKDTTAPSAVDASTIKVQKNADSDYSVSWDASSDDNGIGAYNIYKDGSLVKSIHSTRVDVSGDAYLDTSVDLTEKGNYQIEAVDCSGNLSNRTAFAVDVAPSSSQASSSSSDVSVPSDSSTPSGNSDTNSANPASSNSNGNPYTGDKTFILAASLFAAVSAGAVLTLKKIKK